MKPKTHFAIGIIGVVFLACSPLVFKANGQRKITPAASAEPIARQISTVPVDNCTPKTHWGQARPRFATTPGGISVSSRIMVWKGDGMRSLQGDDNYVYILEVYPAGTKILDPTQLVASTFSDPIRVIPGYLGVRQIDLAASVPAGRYIVLARLVGTKVEDYVMPSGDVVQQGAVLTSTRTELVVR